MYMLYLYRRVIFGTITRDEVRAMLEALLEYRTDGLILVSPRMSGPQIVADVGALPCVVIGRRLRDGHVDCVMTDEAMGAHIAVEHLVELGHRRIATITGMLDKRTGADRLRAYRTEMQALGLAYRDEYVAYGDFYVDSGHRAMARLLELDEPPTAVVAGSDLMALGAIRAVAEAGRSVPDDVSIVGFDDIQLAGHVHPPLTTLRQDKAGLGAEAGRALMALIDGQTDLPEAVTLPVELIVRGSTTAPPSGA